jgi:nicotinate phosphoribosyltransferase
MYKVHCGILYGSFWAIAMGNQNMNYWTNRDIDRIRHDYYTASYFHRTKSLLLKHHNQTEVMMQVFQRRDKAVICGMNEVIELFKYATGCWIKDVWKNCRNKITLRVLSDGAMVKAREPVMQVVGPYVYFAHLESLYLGILARRTLVATNAYNAVKAAGKKSVFLFADRFDYFSNQEGDGYAARIGGVSGVCTPAQSSWWNGEPIGTIPHAFIALHRGDTVRAASEFSSHYPHVPLVALVDYNNDCVGTSVKVAQVLGDKLWGVRLDTGSDMTDISLGNTEQKGVTPRLVYLVRQALNAAGFPRVKIVVSGGFTADKIKLFEKEKSPVDSYGVGSWMLKGNNDFTADIVKVEGRSEAKRGRGFMNSRRLKVV